VPTYRCPKCGRTVVKPKGVYYCASCGPEYMMWEEAPKRVRRVAPRPFEKMRDIEVVLEAEEKLNALPTEDLKDVLSELNRRFPEYRFDRFRSDLTSWEYELARSLRALKERLKKPAS